MKNRQQIIATMLVIITLLVFLPVSAFASYKYEALKFNKWYKVSNELNKLTIYEIQVSSDTVIIIQWKDYDRSECWGNGSICKDKKCEKEIVSFLGNTENSSGKRGIVLYPGKYYLKMYLEDGKKTQVKISKKATSTINKQNYCLQNAITLAKNKSVEFAQTKKNCYNRWFKIVLTKRQKISIVSNRSIYRCDIYDSKLNDIMCEGKGDELNDYHIETTNKKLPKGTYYICFTLYNISDILDYGYYYNLYWK